MKQVRTRFAPSPTGYLHVGGVRTALFAWLIAKQNKGKFILRLEDTDKNREVEGSTKHIQESLKWLNINWDEGVDIGGEYGPYLQSERLDIYKKWAEKLIDNGCAYADPYTPEQVQKFREEAQKAKKPFLYRNHRPNNPPKWDGTKPLRFKSEPKDYTWHDEVMGEISTGPEVIDDFILIKSDGYPTYNFAHIVDDAEMKISHVIRSQEFLSSVPNYLNTYEALSLDKPILATVPFVMGADGRKKLSKRDGAKDVLDYAREGYLPEALTSFMATLGWNDGTEQEVFTVDELIKKFSLDRVGRGGAHFDEKRLDWVNGSFIRRLSLESLIERSKEFLPESAKKHSDDYVKSVLQITQERLKYFAELPELIGFFFDCPKFTLELIDSDKKLKKIDKKHLADLLSIATNKLKNTEFNARNLRDCFDELLKTTNEKPAVLLGILRLSVSRVQFSPNLPETLEVLGKDETLSRIKEVMLKLNS